jgi:parallel beta-helix repeat protein
MPDRHLTKDPAAPSSGPAGRAGRHLRLTIVGAVVLAAILLFAFASPALAFSDVPVDHPYAGAIDDLSSLGIISGYSGTNGPFGLNNPVKRAQFAKMIVGTLGITPNASTSTRFTDLGSPDATGYPHRFVQTAFDNGITYGKNLAQTVFAPWDYIKRDQVVSMIVRGVNTIFPGALIVPPAGTPTDFYDVPEPHGANLRIAEYNGLLDGLIGLGPNWSVTADATRGEVAQMLWNVLYLLTPSGVWVYEDGSGDYPTIEAAVADIETGTTINLGPGTFHLSQTLLVDFSFNLVGSGMEGPNGTTVTCDDTVIDVYSVNFSAQDIQFETIGSGAPTDVMDAGDATIDLQRCSFSGAVRWNDSQGDGLYLYGTTTATVTDCAFINNGLHGVEVDEDADATLENNLMYGNGENGITFWANSTGVVSGNESSSNGLNGISVNDDAQVLVENNVCLENEYTGIRFGGYATGIIRNNECSDSFQEDGIGLYEDSSATVEDNLCLDNAEAGIYFGDYSYGTASGNECAGNTWGLAVDATATPDLGINDLHDNTYDLSDARLL